MIIHTFFDKCNTIFENSEFNTGYNPVAELNAGSILSRILIHFDLNKLKQQLLNGEKVKLPTYNFILGKTISTSFIGYAPFDDPKYTFVVISPNISSNKDKNNYKVPINRYIIRDITDFLFEK